VFIVYRVCHVMHAHTEEVMMTDTRRLRAGYVTVAMSMPDEMATILRVQALLHHKSIGDYVTSLLPREALAGAGMFTRETNQVMEPTVKAPGKPREAPRIARATSASEGTRAELWQALEARREAEGWDDGDIAQPLGIATRNVSQWRKAGMVTSTQVGAVEKLLNQATPKPGNLSQA
jgi:hypothetical protein